MDTNELRRLILNMIRKGVIMAVDPTSKPPTCRVSSGELETDWLPWFALAAGETRDWNPPTDGEQVMLFCPSGDPAQGVVLRGLYSDAAPAPSDNPAAHLRTYPDGASISYDHATHMLKAELPDGASVLIVAPGSVTVQTENATVKSTTVLLDADQTTCSGNLLVTGALSFEGGMSGKGGKGKTIKIEGGADFTEDVTAAGTSLHGHKHICRGNGNLSDPPQ